MFVVHQIVLAVSLTVSTALSQVPCGINLVVNGGCEQGVMGWTSESGNWACQRGPNVPGTTPAARGGQWYFFAGNTATDAVLFQDVSIPGVVPGQRFRLTSWAASASQSPQPGSDTSRIELECRSANGAVLASSSSVSIGSILAWSPLFANIQAVSGTSILRVKLISHRNLGVNNDGYHDDVVLVALPDTGTGQSNGPLAFLQVEGAGTASRGPFHAPLSTTTPFATSILDIAVSGTPFQPVLLILGILQPGASNLGCSGDLDLVSAQPLFGALMTDASGSLQLHLPLPVLPAGLGFGLQAAVGSTGACPFALSASFCVVLT